MRVGRREGGGAQGAEVREGRGRGERRREGQREGAEVSRTATMIKTTPLHDQDISEILNVKLRKPMNIAFRKTMNIALRKTMNIKHRKQ